MTIDFESEMIRWYSDEQLIGETVLCPQFKYSELYVVFGMRDKDVSVAFLEEWFVHPTTSIQDYINTIIIFVNEEREEGDQLCP